MKRIFPLMLAVLLLAGCTGKGNTETSAQTTAPQTEPTGLHISDHETETATSGAVRAYGITGTGVYAVQDGIAVVDAEGHLTVMDREEGMLLYTASNITNVLTVQGSCVYYYDEAVCRYDYVTEETDSWVLPEDMLGDFAIGTETQEIYYCVSGGVYALEMETGLARMLRQHSYEQQTILGAYFGGSVIGWETEEGIAYLSTADGSELCWEQGIYELQSQGDRYYALRLDGIVEQVIAGTKDGEAKLIKLTKEGLAPVLSMNGVVQAAAGEGLTLSYVDLSTGMKTAAVTIPGETACIAVTGADGFVWALTENMLYRWQIAKSPVTDDAVYTGPVYTAKNPEPEGMAQCESRVSQMNKDYSVRIRIGQDAVSQPGENELTVEYQPDAINLMLDALEPLLGQYPKNFLKKTVETGWVRICLVRQINGEAGYAHYWVDGDCYIAIALGADLEEAFLTGLGGAVDSHILGNSRDLEYWDTMNPEGFEYVYDGEIPEEYSQYIGTHFVDETSMTYPSEDRAWIFYYAMTVAGEEFFKEPVLQQKLKTLCEGIREAYGLKKNTETFPWEQYLEEPLAYVK